MTGNIKCILNLQFLFLEYSKRFYNKINLFLFFFVNEFLVEVEIRM